MMQTASSTTQRRRLVLASAIVVAIVFAPAAVELALPEQAVEEVAQDSSMIPVEWGSSTPESALNEIESFLDGTASTVPIQFEEEAGLPPGARDVRVSNGGKVIGFIVDGEPGEAVAAIDGLMETKGWTPVDLGGISGKTYVRNGGSFAQIVMTATQIGGSTSIVMRCVHR